MRIPGSDLIFFHFYISIFRFLLLNVSFLQKRATTKTWLESSVFGIEKEVEIWNSKRRIKKKQSKQFKLYL